MMLPIETCRTEAFAGPVDPARTAPTGRISITPNSSDAARGVQAYLPMGRPSSSGWSIARARHNPRNPFVARAGYRLATGESTEAQCGCTNRPTTQIVLQFGAFAVVSRSFINFFDIDPLLDLLRTLPGRSHQGRRYRTVSSFRRSKTLWAGTDLLVVVS
jgi:hypothetical protein